MKELVWVNKSDKDYCEVSDLVPNWETILSDYMSSRYIKCIKFDVHCHYYIAIEYVDDELNKAGITVDSIDNIVDCIKIKFKDEHSRDLVFNVLNVWE